MWCTHCNAREVVPLPMSVMDLERLSADWIRRHGRCPRPELRDHQHP